MDEPRKKILVSGVKPTGTAHIGNYFGAMRQFVNMADEFRSFFMIADYHALTTVQNAHEMSENTFNVAIDYLAIGLDPQKSVIFKQSDVPEHTELTWIFNCITTVPYLSRAHAFKDAEAKNKEVNVGLFNYPMLMATDILMYDADVVPVGRDQKQHVEMAHDTAKKFNRIFGETFKVPAERIVDDVAVVPGIDGQKMSKSYGNVIPLFAEDAEIDALVAKIVTDSRGASEPKDQETDTIFALHRLFSTNDLEVLEERYRTGDISYQESKQILAENIKRFIAPLRAKRKKIASDKGYVADVLKEGGEKAREVAGKKMQIVREKIGVRSSTLH